VVKSGNSNIFLSIVLDDEEDGGPIWLLRGIAQLKTKSNFVTFVERE
jgi:hypothetical protein